ncbi:MAG: hypothetical protein U0228_27625 [Myxococcaceae bacterium]
MNRVLLLSSAVIVLTACPGPAPVPDGGTTDGGSVSGACASEHSEVVAGQTVAVCEAIFASAPFVKLPADSADVVYGGFGHDSAGQAIFKTRTTSITLPQTLPAWFDAESTFGQMRYAYFIYRAQLSGGAITSVTPVVRIDDRVFQRMLGGLVLEGQVSALDGGDFILTPELPLRVKLDPAPETTATDTSTGWDRYAIGGTIENAAGGVRASDGGCLAALSSFGAKNPLSGADGGVRVKLLRHPGMHVPFDDVFTFDWPEGVTSANNMGPGLYVPVSALLGTTPPVFTEASSHPHGVPWGGPTAELQVVTGGGQSCP